MAAHSSATEEDMEEDFDCPVCQDVLWMPVRTKNCQHVFCRTCLETAVKTQGPQCPLCRGPVVEKHRKASDVQQRMRTRKGTCRACGTEKFYSKMRLHYKTCRRYMEEYGPITNTTSPTPSNTHVQAPVQTPVQTPVLHGGFPPIAVPTPPSRGGRVYSCPYCPLVTLTDLALVQHCVGQHSGQAAPTVCPICVRMPWGDSAYYSPNLISHMLRRHCFSYTEYMNEEEDEDVQLCQALQMSVQEF